MLLFSWLSGKTLFTIQSQSRHLHPCKLLIASPLRPVLPAWHTYPPSTFFMSQALTLRKQIPNLPCKLYPLLVLPCRVSTLPSIQLSKSETWESSQTPPSPSPRILPSSKFCQFHFHAFTSANFPFHLTSPPPVRAIIISCLNHCYNAVTNMLLAWSILHTAVWKIP